MGNYLYDAAGNPVHGSGTQIERDSEGNSIYDCPHCGRHWVRSDKVKDMEKYVRRGGRKLPRRASQTISRGAPKEL